MKIGDLVRTKHYTYNRKIKAGSVGLVVQVVYDDPDDPSNSHARLIINGMDGWWPLDYLEAVK